MLVLCIYISIVFYSEILFIDIIEVFAKISIYHNLRSACIIYHIMHIIYHICQGITHQCQIKLVFPPTDDSDTASYIRVMINSYIHFWFCIGW